MSHDAVRPNVLCFLYGHKNAALDPAIIDTMIFENVSKCTKVPFLPRDAMHKRGLCRHAVSVRPPVTFVDHVKTNKNIFEIFSPSGSHTILVFPY